MKSTHTSTLINASQPVTGILVNKTVSYLTFKDEAQTALFKDQVRTAL
jgi:hypothetical protein